jgi:hypothetical protein
VPGKEGRERRNSKRKTCSRVKRRKTNDFNLNKTDKVAKTKQTVGPEHKKMIFFGCAISMQTLDK